MFHMPNPDILRATRRVPDDASAEARESAHRRDWQAVLRARRRAALSRALNRWLAGGARYVRALLGWPRSDRGNGAGRASFGRTSRLTGGGREPAGFGDCAGAG